MDGELASSRIRASRVNELAGHVGIVDIRGLCVVIRGAFSCCILVDEVAFAECGRMHACMPCSLWAPVGMCCMHISIGEEYM